MPDEWVEVKLSELFSLDNSKLGERDVEPRVLSLSKYDGFVPADEYFDKRIASRNLDGYKLVTENGWAYSTIHIDEGSIARNTLGYEGVISPMYTTMAWASDDHSPEFFELLLKSPSLLVKYGSLAQGTVNRRRSLPFKTFADLTVTVPPLAVQRRIVDLLAHLDNHLANLQAERDAAEAVLCALRSRIFAGATDAIPLSSVARVERGASWSANQESPDGKFPVIRIANVQPSGLDLNDLKRVDGLKALDVTRAQISPFSLLMVGSNGNPKRVGNVYRSAPCIEGAVLASFLIGIHACSDVQAEYLWHVLASEEVQTRITYATAGSTGLKNLSIEWLRALLIPDFSTEKQAEAVALLKPANDCVVLLSREVGSILRIRHALLVSLLSGDLEIPSDYDSLLSEVA